MKADTKKRLARMAQEMVDMADEVQRAIEANDLDTAEGSADALLSEASRFMQSLPGDDEE